MKKKISWPAYKALLITGVTLLVLTIPLAMLGVLYLGYWLGSLAYLLTE